MQQLFDEHFQDRIELQRRQVFHQELLEGREVADVGETPREWFSPVPERVVERGVDLGLFAKLGLMLALVCFVFTIPAAMLSAIAAAPIATLSKLLAPRSRSFREIYSRAAIAVFTYLFTTAIALSIVYAFLDPQARILLAQQFLSAPAGMTPQSGLATLAVFLPGLLVLWGVQRRR